MPLDGLGADNQALPLPMVGLAQQALARAAGAALVVATAVAWVGLITWSSGDPSLTQGAAGPARNLLGPLGAALSDLALQLLGFTAPIAVFAPLVWGAELLIVHRVPRFSLKVSVLPFAVLALAGACSAFPVVAAWPLRHGYGGILGDIIHNLAANVCVTLGPIKPRVLAGLMLACAGLAALGFSLGLSIRDLAVRVRRRGVASYEPPAWRPDLATDLSVSPRVEPDLPFARSASPVISDGDRRRSDRGPPLQRSGALLPGAEDDLERSDWADDFQNRGAEFDAITDRTSRELARRFAPSRPVSAPRDPGSATASSTRVVPERDDAIAAPLSLALLRDPPGARPAREITEAVLRGNGQLLQDALADLGVIGKIRGMRPGPAVTLYEFEPARGTKPSRVFGLADDIARLMGTPGVRVGPLSEGHGIGIEIPTVQPTPVSLREILESDSFRHPSSRLPVALGKGIDGQALVIDLARLPHLLIAGAAGSGKSVALHSMVLSLLLRLPADCCRMLMIDPKMLDLCAYNGIPHLLAPVVTERNEAVAALQWVVREMDARYYRMARLGVKTIAEFNDRVGRAETQADHASERMAHLVVVVDEFADLMVVAARDVEAAVQRLAQMAAGAGIHLLMATQRPSIDIISGPIKASFAARLCCKVASKMDSRTILNEAGAEQLMGPGDMLLAAGGQVLRVQGAFVSAEEVGNVAHVLRRQGKRDLRAA